MEAQPVGKELNYSPNEYFTKKLSSGRYLVTTRHRGFAILGSDEYHLLWSGAFSEDKTLFEKLERSGIILTEKNLKGIIESLEKQYLFILAPRTYRINLSNECNLQCSYCLSNAGADQHETMSKETMDATIKFIISGPGNVFYIEFQGGEPLAKFGEIRYFVEKIKKCAEAEKKNIVKIVIVTNLTLMNDEIAEYLIENNIGFCSSLDGPKELHDAHRKFSGGGGSYETVTKWLSYFRERKKTINLIPTITLQSLKFGAKSIIDEYVKQGCRRVSLRPVYHVGRAAKNKDLHLPAEEFIRFWKEGIEYMANLSSKGIVVCDPAIQAMIRNIMGSPVSYMCMRKPCGAAVSHISVSPDGTIFPCDLAKTFPALMLGTVNESYLDIALRTAHMAARTQEAYPLCDACAFGPYCGTCFTRTYAAFRDTIPRTPKDFECKVNKAMLTYLFEKIQDAKYRNVFELWARQRW